MGAHHEILQDLYPRGLVRQKTAHDLCARVLDVLASDDIPKYTQDYGLKKLINETLALYEQLASTQLTSTKITKTKTPHTKNA